MKIGRASIKNENPYESLKHKIYSKENAARITNSDGARKCGGKASNYEERTKQELYSEAKELEIEGRSSMSKEELIHALRNN